MCYLTETAGQMLSLSRQERTGCRETLLVENNSPR